MSRPIDFTKLTRPEFEALWDALQQYCDNNNPEECGEDVTKPAVFAAARKMLDACDAHAASGA